MAKAHYPNLRELVDELRRDGELVEVEAPVEARLEVAEIHRRVVAAGGPALVFRRVTREGDGRGGDTGSELPVAHGKGGEREREREREEGRGGEYRFSLVSNLFGTPGRAERAFGRRPGEIVRRLAEFVETTVPPPTWGQVWGMRDVAFDLLKMGMKQVSRGPVTEVVDREMGLDELPVTTSWPEDGGPFFTLPLVYTEHPETKGSNLGIYRMQVHEPRVAGMHWQIGKGGGFHYAVAEERGEALPATVFLGGPPALIMAAIAPLPENVPEMLLASLIAGEKLRRAPGPGPHSLVAEAEVALVGKVPPRVRRPEGPFGDHYGYYSLTHDYPVFELEAICHRRDAMLPATVVGKPRQEDFFIGDLLQKLLSPIFPLVMPGVVDLWSYGETGYHSLAAAVVKERYEREAMASAFRILGEGQLSLTKFLLVTDRAVDLKDFRATLVHLLERTDPETDLYVLGNLSMDSLDYTGPEVNRGSKGVWLGLGEKRRELPGEFSAPELPMGCGEVEVFCPGCLVVGAPRFEEEPGAAARFAEHAAFAGWQLVVLSDEPRRAAASAMNFLWTTFTRFEPAADIHAASVRVVRNQLSYSAPIVIDARLKPGFPDELFCSEEVAERVSRRWKEYFPGGGVEMGDSGLAHLDPAG